MRNIPLNCPPLIDDLSGDMTHFIITDAAALFFSSISIYSLDCQIHTQYVYTSQQQQHLIPIARITIDERIGLRCDRFS